MPIVLLARHRNLNFERKLESEITATADVRLQTTRSRQERLSLEKCGQLNVLDIRTDESIGNVVRSTIT